MTTQTRRKRFRAMLWSLLFIAVGAVALPAASYLLAPAEAQAQSQNAGGAEKNPRANFWRAVRIGESGYSAVAAGESGVFINNGGQNWRQMRNRIISAYGGWGILLALGAVLAYHLLHGRVALREARSGMTVPRWKTWERALHWYTAALFVVLAVTGLSM
ncbi:MAG: formate dehydrogenase subunit gamma, partial [Alphaproteobacteria bacterium]|nr:formate dehydrogenase subunit gamma [Alphaproteobacteria bacterium]